MAYVVESNQSNFTPVVFGSDGHLPLREATRTALPFDESSGIMRLDTLPVPPVRSMLLFEDMILLRWVDRWSSYRLLKLYPVIDSSRTFQANGNRRKRSFESPVGWVDSKGSPVCGHLDLMILT